MTKRSVLYDSLHASDRQGDRNDADEVTIGSASHGASVRHPDVGYSCYVKEGYHFGGYFYQSNYEQKVNFIIGSLSEPQALRKHITICGTSNVMRENVRGYENVCENGLVWWYRNVS